MCAWTHTLSLSLSLCLFLSCFLSLPSLYLFLTLLFSLCLLTFDPSGFDCYKENVTNSSHISSNSCASDLIGLYAFSLQAMVMMEACKTRLNIPQGCLSVPSPWRLLQPSPPRPVTEDLKARTQSQALTLC